MTKVNVRCFTDLTWVVWFYTFGILCALIADECKCLEKCHSISVMMCDGCACVRLQCHEACIAIYSSMENQKLSHWMWISVLSMFFCLLIYTLTGGFLSKDLSASWLCPERPCPNTPPSHPPLQVCMASWPLDKRLPQTFWCPIQETMWSWSFPGCFSEYRSSPSTPLFFSWEGESCSR